MLKPPMPGMTDTLEFVKNLWGGMGIPGAMPGMPAPALSVDDLDKKIADLKAVEAWLNLNQGMLRGTIQALEVQRGTLATLKAMGESMSQAMQGNGGGSDAMSPFAQFFNQAAHGGAAAKPAAGAAQAKPAPQPEPQSALPPGADAAQAAMPAAIAWWNMLQDQFKQAVASAMPPDAGSTPDASGPAAAPRAAGSPADVSGGAADYDEQPGAGETNPTGGRRSTRGKTDKA